MIKANKTDKKLVIDILTNSFDDNKSINYLINNDKNRIERINALMAYSFDICFMFGEVYLSENKLACALVLHPEKKKISLFAIWADIKLVFQSIKIYNVGKAMARESRIKMHYPKHSYYYLWFLGVQKEAQNKGTGSKLLNDIIQESLYLNKPIYLETSTIKNIPWYSKFNFVIYNEIDLGYKLFMLKRGSIPML
uniref:GNAT family N-acetyltransferase n=1 Tax=Pedobacter sp. TaxID=1411316 RepID=UPI00159B7174|nr:GNAT family N-acetyltransferase [Pedobacter sp.]QJS06231.1 GNAT family N-acetyltransferase [Pedobacter sp.]